jgi:hypothetical protein
MPDEADGFKPHWSNSEGLEAYQAGHRLGERGIPEEEARNLCPFADRYSEIFNIWWAGFNDGRVKTSG